MPSIPDKKYFKIGEASRIAGLEPHVLRFWETEFNYIRPRKDGGNQRLYTKRDLEKVLEIKRLLYEEGFTLAGAKKKLKKTGSANKGALSAPSDAGMKEHLEVLKKGLEEIRDMLS